MSRPINDKHSIEVAAFVLIFSRHFLPEEVASLASLKETLKDKLPSFEFISSIEISYEANVVSHRQSEKKGVLLQKIKPDGKPAWLLRVEQNSILVNCFEYERWDTSFPPVLDLLIHAARLVSNDENPLSSVVHQVVDRFVLPTECEYSIAEVFEVESKYLTRQATESGNLWHVHQGWFDVQEDMKLLNVLNLGTNVTPSGHISTIDHAIHLRDKVLPAEKAANSEWLEMMFGLMHEKNKTIVRDLLNTVQLEAIGLNES